MLRLNSLNLNGLNHSANTEVSYLLITYGTADMTIARAQTDAFATSEVDIDLISISMVESGALNDSTFSRAQTDTFATAEVLA